MDFPDLMDPNFWLRPDVWLWVALGLVVVIALGLYFGALPGFRRP